MLHYFLLPMDCRTEDVLNKLKPFLLIHNDKYYTFVKRECFANPSFIHFFQKNEISFDFYNKENEIKLVTISSLYLKSISELHIKFNSVMKNNFIPNLFFFWNNSVVPVMMNLNMTPLISEEVSLEIQAKKNLSLNNKF